MVGCLETVGIVIQCVKAYTGPNAHAMPAKPEARTRRKRDFVVQLKGEWVDLLANVLVIRDVKGLVKQGAAKEATPRATSQSRSL